MPNFCWTEDGASQNSLQTTECGAGLNDADVLRATGRARTKTMPFCERPGGRRPKQCRFASNREGGEHPLPCRQVI